MCVHQKACIRMLTAILFTILNWKQTKCSPTDEWVSCGKYIQWNMTDQKKRTIATYKMDNSYRHSVLNKRKHTV